MEHAYFELLPREEWCDYCTGRTTVANARTAHGILGVDELRSSLRAALTHCARVAPAT